MPDPDKTTAIADADQRLAYIDRCTNALVELARQMLINQSTTVAWAMLVTYLEDARPAHLANAPSDVDNFHRFHIEQLAATAIRLARQDNR